MKLSLGFSPCPNDTFIFDALIHHKIDTEGLEFDVFFDDVEELNQKGINSVLDITKLSYAAYGYLSKNYILSNAGSALGNHCGPLFITLSNNSQNINNHSLIGIPGKYTTANFLFNFAYPDFLNKKILVFSDIENAVLNGKINAGIIIHENRFTYQDKGLDKILDLGDYWETTTGFPIPLGGIAIKRSLGNDLHLKIQRLIRKSIEYAFKNQNDSVDFIKTHSQEMDDAVIKSHIQLYVNDFSIDLGKKGRDAVEFLLLKMHEINKMETPTQPLFVK